MAKRDSIPAFVNKSFQTVALTLLVMSFMTALNMVSDASDIIVLLYTDEMRLVNFTR